MMSEDFAMEWHDICRVCLRDGELISFYTKDECDISFCDKIMYCAAVNINSGENLPESICQSCVQDLETAFRFRTLCENSDKILQSYKIDDAEFLHDEAETLVLSEKGGSIFQYKLPQDLKVQKINDPQSTNNPKKSTKRKNKIKTSRDENYFDNENEINELQRVYKQEIVDNEFNENEFVNDEFVTNEFVVNENDCEREIEEVTVKIEMNSEDENEDDGLNVQRIHLADHQQQLVCGLYNSDGLDLAREIRLANAELVELDSEHVGQLDELGIKTENDGQSGYLIIKKIPQNNSEILTAEELELSVINNKSVNSKKNNTNTSSTSNRGRRKRDEKIARPHMCEICGKTYRYNFNLEAHMRRHTGEKPFECHICGRGFVISFELRRHMRSHTGQKPYKCKYCDRKFSDFGSRIKHQRSHTGERPYACDVCGKTFAYSHVLSSHKLIHSGIKAYKCDACDKRFTKSHHLKAHLNVHLRNGVVRTAKVQPKLEPIDQDCLLE